jgi:hypothetical protein
VKKNSWSPETQKRDLGHSPAHRDETAMNRAQLPMAYGGSLGLMSGPPAEDLEEKTAG